MREKSPFSVGNLTVGTASKWRLGVLAAAVRGILAVRAPALVRSAGPGAIPGKISEGGSIGGVEQGVMRPRFTTVFFVAHERCPYRSSPSSLTASSPCTHLDAHGGGLEPLPHS